MAKKKFCLLFFGERISACKMLLKMTKVVNFFNILQAAFLYKSVLHMHSFSDLTVSVCHFLVKGRKMLVKMTVEI